MPHEMMKKLYKPRLTIE